MSVATAVDNVVSTLRTISALYAGLSSNMAVSAREVATTLKTPSIDELEFDVSRSKAGVARVPNAPTIKGVYELELPEQGDLQSLSAIDGELTATPPELTIPDFTYNIQADAPDLSASSPNITDLTIEPEVPELSDATAPEFTVPTLIQADILSGTPPDITRPSFTDFTGDFIDEYHNGLGELGPLFTEYSATLDALWGELAPLDAALRLRIQAVLQGTEPGLPDTWESKSYAQTQQEAFFDRLGAIDKLDKQPSSITGLPTGVSSYGRQQLEFAVLQQLAKAAATVAINREQAEVQHLKWALELSSKLISTAFELRGQALLWRLKAIQLALDGAKATLDVAVRVLEFEVKKVELQVQYNDIQIRRAKDSMAVEKSKLEKLEIDIANNKLYSTYNQHQAQVYKLAGDFIKTRIDLFSTQIEHLVAKGQLDKLKVESFDAEVAAYVAKLKAITAEQNAIKAQIKGDLAKADGELAKVKLYMAELDGNVAVVQAAAARNEALATTMAQQLEAYESTVNAQLAVLREADKGVAAAVDAFMAGFNVEFESEHIKAANQALLDSSNLSEARVAMEQDKLELDKILGEHMIMLMKNGYQADLMIAGSNTLGAIAQAAFSGCNSVGATEVAAEA